jgi:hypothetical protein
MVNSTQQNQELFQGEKTHVSAKITYSNGTIVRYGEFSAIVYPASVSGQYSTLMHTEYAAGQLVGLAYDPGTQTWVGNVTLPSSADQGSLAALGITTFDYSGPYDAYVTGLSADGTPTDSALSAQQAFFVQPYVYTTGVVRSLTAGGGLAFVNATIATSGSLRGDRFMEANTIKDSVLTISGSSVEGLLNIVNSNVTMVGVSGGDISLSGSVLSLKDSSVNSLTLSESNVTLSDSSYGKVAPAVPEITFNGLLKPIEGVSSYQVNVTGAGLTIGGISAWVDGTPVQLGVNSTSGGLLAIGTVNATALGDGVHVLTVTAAQSDGLSSSSTTTFTTDAHQHSLQSQASTLFSYATYLGVVSAAALVVGVIALLRSRRPAHV